MPDDLAHIALPFLQNTIHCVLNVNLMFLRALLRMIKFVAGSSSQATLFVLCSVLALANSCDLSECSNGPLEGCKRSIGDCDNIDLYVSFCCMQPLRVCSRGLLLLMTLSLAGHGTG